MPSLKSLVHLTMTLGACVVGNQGSTPAPTPEPTIDEAACFSQNTLPLADDYVLSWGSALGDAAYDIATIGGDLILMGGSFDPTVFRGPGGAVIPFGPGPDSRRAFVARFSPTGELRWSMDLPTRRVAIDPHLAVASDGSIFVVGHRELDATTVEVFVRKVDGTGAQLWERTWPAKAASIGMWVEPLIATASDGSVYVVERNASPDIRKLSPDGTIAVTAPSGHPMIMAIAIAADDTLVAAYGDDASSGLARYDATGTQSAQQAFAEKLGVTGLSANADGSTIVAGTRSVSNAGMDAFVASFAADGTQQWLHSWGSRGNDRIWKLARAADGRIIVGGSYYKTVDFAPDAAVDERTSRRQDAMLVVYDAAGSYLGARTWGGTEQDRVMTVAVDDAGRVYAAGTTDSDVNFGSVAPDVRENAGHSDGFAIALAPATQAAASGAACLPVVTTSPASAKLAGTGLPESFDACAASPDNFVLYGEEGDGTCWFSVSEIDDQALFDACISVGGGESIVDGEASYSLCDIVYDETKGPCFGNFCD